MKSLPTAFLTPRSHVYMCVFSSSTVSEVRWNIQNYIRYPSFAKRTFINPTNKVIRPQPPMLSYLGMERLEFVAYVVFPQWGEPRAHVQLGAVHYEGLWFVSLLQVSHQSCGKPHRSHGTEKVHLSLHQICSRLKLSSHFTFFYVKNWTAIVSRRIFTISPLLISRARVAL